jgi:hypothetical protein
MHTTLRFAMPILAVSSAAMMAGCGGPSVHTQHSCYGLVNVTTCTTTMGPDGKRPIPVVTPIWSDGH